jgi:mono/diheme cytochrome c family protein
MRNLQKFAPLALAVILVGCRQDMHDQPRFKSLAKSDFYADQRSARNPVEGTVARGQLHEDVYFYTGKVGANPGNYLPFAATAEVVARGRERYNIYCAPCHSQVGDGRGMIVQRGFQAPPTLHQTRLRNAPLGYLFDVITNGFGAMPDYASQIPPRDRWAIVAYIKALQLSQSATAADVPSGQQMPSPELEFHGDPPSGAVQPELHEKGAPPSSEEPK